MLLTLLVATWGVVTAVLITLVIYRSTLSVREDDQIYINATDQGRAEEQKATISKIERLKTPIVGLAVVSGVLLLGSLGVWLYSGFKS